MAIRDWCRFMGTGTASSSLAAPGRTPTWRASTAGCATSSSPARSSTASWRRESSSTTGRRLQPTPPPQRARLPGTRRLRRGVELAKGGLRPDTISERGHPRWLHHHPGTLIEGGPGNGVRSTRPSGVSCCPCVHRSWWSRNPLRAGPGVQSQADWKALGTSCGLRQTTAHSDALVVRRWPPLDVVARVKPTLGGPHLAETKRR